MFGRYGLVFVLCGVCIAWGCGRSNNGKTVNIRDRDGAVDEDGDGGTRNVDPPTGAGENGGSGNGSGGVNGEGGMAGGVVVGGSGPFPAGSGGPAGVGGGFVAGAGGFSGGAGTGPRAGRGGVGGAGTVAPLPTCEWREDAQLCLYPNGSQCNNVYCCYQQGNRCCDNSGKCSDDIPPPPEWVPPFDEDLIGDPGWKDSEDTLCVGEGGTDYFASWVWSDARGVFISASGYPQGNGMYDPDCPGCAYQQVYFNNGSGWTTVEGGEAWGQQAITGFENGPIVLFGSAQPIDRPQGYGQCGIAFLEDGERLCEAVDGVSAVSVAGPDLAYATVNGDLIRYDGADWGPNPVLFPGGHELYALWSTPEVVFATGQSPGSIYTLRGTTWAVEDTKTLEYFSSIYGLSPTDVWAGTIQGHLYHYDGTSWTQIDWEAPACAQQQIGVMNIWGKDGTVYFAAGTVLAKWNGTSVETVAEWECDPNQSVAYISAMWGNSPTELFLVISDYSAYRQPCGNTFLLYYDGSQFHRM